MAGAMALGDFAHWLESRLAPSVEAPATNRIDELEAAVDVLAQAVDALRQQAAQPESAIFEAQTDHPEPEPVIQTSWRVRADLIDQLVNEAGEVAIARTRVEAEMRHLKRGLQDMNDNVSRLRAQLREVEIQAESRISAGGQALEADAADDFDALELDRYTRFQELTRQLAEAVGDVATVQHSLNKHLESANVALQAQARLSRGVQQGLMSIRMLPFASQRERLFRVLRQTAKALDKRAHLEILGGEVEIDRGVLDRMVAPLEHMLRNAVAHGIEAPAERRAQGKPEHGEIRVSVSQEGSEIVLSLADDGRGLDLERIRARGVALGLLPPDVGLADPAVPACIFQPGFSTAGELSTEAGRGIGMDVVKAEVSALGGRIEIASEAGQGTRFQLYLPQSLALMQALLVREGERVYAFPATLVEHFEDVDATRWAAWQAAGEVVVDGLRYPLHALAGLLQQAAPAVATHPHHAVLRLRSGLHQLALVVDSVIGKQEIVVKPLGSQLAHLPGLLGATVLGDGRIVLILNPVPLAGQAPVAIPSPPAAASPPAPTILIVDDSVTVRKFTGRLLTRAGYQVVLAKDGVEALERLAEIDVQAILTDLEMPRMDGFELIGHLRSEARWAQVPITVITSRTAEKHRSHALALGANHYLGKPYEEASLLALLAPVVAPVADASA